jgi:hypothetical protein
VTWLHSYRYNSHAVPVRRCRFVCLPKRIVRSLPWVGIANQMESSPAPVSVSYDFYYLHETIQIISGDKVVLEISPCNNRSFPSHDACCSNGIPLAVWWVVSREQETGTNVWKYWLYYLRCTLTCSLGFLAILEVPWKKPAIFWSAVFRNQY